MILLKEDMIKAIENKDIYISKKVSLDDLNPNSINVSLDKTLKTYTPFKIKRTKAGLMFVKTKDIVLDVKKKNKIYEQEIPEEGIILSPDMFYLGNTIEKAGSDVYIPMYEGRSSLARLGLVSHFSAGFGDVGFKAQWTLEIGVREPLKIYPGMRIGQVYFVKGTSAYPKYMYKGKYSNQSGPQESKMYLDYVKEKINLIDELKKEVLDLQNILHTIGINEIETYKDKIKEIMKEIETLELEVKNV